MDEVLDFELDIDEQILGCMHNIVRAKVPTWYINPEFKLLFGDEDRSNLETIFDSCYLEFADTLPPVLDDNKTPPLSFFKGLPEPVRGRWAIYAATMEQPG